MRKIMLAIALLIIGVMLCSCGADGKTARGARISVYVPEGYSYCDGGEFNTMTVSPEDSKTDAVQIAITDMGYSEADNIDMFKSLRLTQDAKLIDNRTIGGIDCMGATYTDEIASFVLYQGVYHGSEYTVTLVNLKLGDETVEKIINSIEFTENKD